MLQKGIDNSLLRSARVLWRWRRWYLRRLARWWKAQDGIPTIGLYSSIETYNHSTTVQWPTSIINSLPRWLIIFLPCLQLGKVWKVKNN